MKILKSFKLSTILPTAFLIISFSLLAFNMSSQSIAKANKLVEDFGLIKNWDNKFKTTFKIKNEGDKPFKIRYVSSNCGCTVPYWDKKMIAPGSSANIEVVFDPTGKRDSFKQHINVYTKANIGRHIRLTVQGKIELDEVRLTPQEKYIRRYGAIRFDNNTATFIPLYQNEIKNLTIVGKNIGIRKIFIEKVLNLPPYIDAKIKQQYLQPNDTFHVRISANGKKINEISKYFKEIKIKTDDFLYQVKTIYVVMDVKQFFPKYSRKQLRKLQRIKIDSSLIDFGKFRKGTKGRDSFLVKNIGKKPLKIWSIKSYCTCLKTDRKSAIIQPGERLMINVYFDPISKSDGPYNRSFEIICNDPKRTIIKVPITAVLF